MTAKIQSGTYHNFKKGTEVQVTDVRLKDNKICCKCLNPKTGIEQYVFNTDLQFNY